MILADWAENALIAPQYARQSAYWASVLCEPEIPEFAEWPMEGARGFQNEPELPFGDAPAVFPFDPAVFASIPCVLCVHKHKISAPREPTPTRANTEMRPIYPSTGAHTHIDSG